MMKTPGELMREYEARQSWKALKLWRWADQFDAKAREWVNVFPPVTDDRRVYINTYTQVYRAIESLPDNPDNWVCVAVNHEMSKEREMMKDILIAFASPRDEGRTEEP